MGEAMLAIVSIYLFVALGFLAKQLFTEQLNERTLVVISVYFLQPFLTIWGLTREPLSIESLTLPATYLVLTFVGLFVMLFFGRILFSDPRDRSILAINSVVGNTGNIGIPLALALFGEGGIYHASLIAIANVFLTYTVGVYYYSRGQFSLRDSLLNIIKLPIVWAALIALLLNASSLEIPTALDNSLKMGAYASLTLQLMLFGTYLHGIKLSQTNGLLLWSSVGGKLLFLPAIALLVVPFLPFSEAAKFALFFQLTVPMAVNNVSLAALYDCKPKQVAIAIFTSSILFALLIPLYIHATKWL